MVVAPEQLKPAAQCICPDPLSHRHQSLPSGGPAQLAGLVSSTSPTGESPAAPFLGDLQHTAHEAFGGGLQGKIRAGIRTPLPKVAPKLTRGFIAAVGPRQSV